MPSIRAIRCTVGPATLAINLNDVVGLQRADAMQVAPHGSPLAGTLAIAHDEVPVYHLGDLLGIEGDRAEHGHLVITRAGGELVGLFVDRVSHLEAISVQSLHPLSPVLGDPRSLCVSGILRIGDDLLPMLAPDRFGSNSGAALVRPAVAPSLSNEITTTVVNDRLILFTAGLGDDHSRPIRFGVGMHQVVEVAELRPIVPVPGANASVPGVCLWRDLVLPVVDLAARVGLQATIDSRDRLIVLRGPSRVGLVAVTGSETRVLRLPTPHEESSRSLAIDRSCLLGAIELRRETVLLPDLSLLLKA